MNKSLALLLIITKLSSSIHAQIIKTEKGIVLKKIGDTRMLELEVISNNIVHIIASQKEDLLDPKAQTQDMQDKYPIFSLKVNEDQVLLKTANLFISINAINGKISFRNNNNDLLLEENYRYFKRTKGLPDNTWEIQQDFKWTNYEILYSYLSPGVTPNIRGQNFYWSSRDTNAIAPIIISSKGYGILWNNLSPTHFYNSSNSGYFKSNEANQLDYYFFFGSSPDEILTNYQKITNKTIDYTIQ